MQQQRHESCNRLGPQWQMLWFLSTEQTCFKPPPPHVPIAANKRLQVDTEVTLLLDYCPVLSQPAHRRDQQSGHLFFCTHPQITVWVIVADNPNYAWVRNNVIIIIKNRSLHFSDSAFWGFLSQPNRGVVSHVTSLCTQALLILISQRAPPPSREAPALILYHWIKS